MAKAKLELNRVHVIEKIPGTQMFRLSGIQPAMQLRQDNDVVWIQRGQLFDGGGEPISADRIPAWFEDQVKRCSPQALAEVGYKRKAD